MWEIDEIRGQPYPSVLLRNEINIYWINSYSVNAVMNGTSDRWKDLMREEGFFDSLKVAYDMLLDMGVDLPPFSISKG